MLGFAIEGRELDSDIDASAVNLAGFEVPAANPITQADIDEFIRTHKRTRYRFGPDGSLTPIAVGTLACLVCLSGSVPRCSLPRPC